MGSDSIDNISNGKLLLDVVADVANMSLPKPLQFSMEALNLSVDAMTE